MKLTDLDRKVLYQGILAALIAKPGNLPRTTPPNKQGEVKNVSPGFGAATWAAHIYRAAVYVLEHEDETPGAGPGEAPGGGGGDTPF